MQLRWFLQLLLLLRGAARGASCHGHNWNWFGCSSEQQLKAPSDRTGGRRLIYFSSLTYGGTDQLTVSTVHLARELNVLNMVCSGMRPPCPIAHVLPVARDLGPAARTNALYLFSEPSRPEVNLARLFDVGAIQKCSSVHITNGISALLPAGAGLRDFLRVHVVLPIRLYSGPLLSHTDAAAMVSLLANQSSVRSVGSQLERVARAFSKAVDRFGRAADAYAAQTGLRLQISRFTLLPDIAKQKGTPRGWSGGPEHACSPPNHNELRPGCGHTFLRYCAENEPNGTLVLFIITESSQQDDLPTNKAMRRYWKPEGSVSDRFVARLLDDERSVIECFPLAKRYAVAVHKLLRSSTISLPVVAWQLRAEKLSLMYHKQGSSWYWKVNKAIQHQMRTIQSKSSECGIGTLLLESDLLQPSATMWETMFPPQLRKHGKQGIRMYGVTNLTQETAGGLLGTLRDTLLRDLRTVGRAMHQPNIMTTKSVLTSFQHTNLSGHALEPFVHARSSLLNVERTLFAVTVMAEADFLLRSPLSSTFSGWANTIRLAQRGPSKAGWGTDDGYRWWRCDLPSNVKLGKCKRGSVKTLTVPTLCEAKRRK